jgi:hypothetical protein
MSTKFVILTNHRHKPSEFIYANITINLIMMIKTQYL